MIEKESNKEIVYFTREFVPICFNCSIERINNGQMLHPSSDYESSLVLAGCFDCGKDFKL